MMLELQKIITFDKTGRITGVHLVPVKTAGDEPVKIADYLGPVDFIRETSMTLQEFKMLMQDPTKFAIDPTTKQLVKRE